MDRFAIFVDAGYFFAAGSQAAFGATVPRHCLSIQAPAEMISKLTAQAQVSADGIPLLRVYWYDAMPGPRLSLEQSQLAILPGVKLRLGVLNNNGEQKGVDSLIVTDLIELARNGAITDAILVSGDEDLRIAVELAQSYGVRIHILAAGEARRNVSHSLQMAADSVSELDGEWFKATLANTSRPQPEAPTIEPRPEAMAKAPVDEPETATLSFKDAAKRVIEELIDADPAQIPDLVQHFSTSSSVPSDFDGKLIARTRALLGEQLTGEQKREARGFFVHRVRERGALLQAAAPSA